MKSQQVKELTLPSYHPRTPISRDIALTQKANIPQGDSWKKSYIDLLVRLRKKK